MTQHPLFPDATWTDSFHKGDHVRSKHTNAAGTVCHVCDGRYVLVRWSSGPVPHLCRHHSPLGLVKA